MLGRMLLVNIDEYNAKTAREQAKIKRILTEKDEGIGVGEYDQNLRPHDFGGIGEGSEQGWMTIGQRLDNGLMTIGVSQSLIPRVSLKSLFPDTLFVILTEKTRHN